MTDPPRNVYSSAWFRCFLSRGSDTRTEPEVAFIARYLPLPRYRRVLDVCCGTGRHVRALIERGYDVTGVDRSAEALALARWLADATAPTPIREGRGPGEGACSSGSRARFILGDMRALGAVPGPFDGMICMWQSFGYFDEEENADVLNEMRRKLDSGGRMILDVYDRLFVEERLGERRFDRDGEWIHERREIVDGRLRVSLEYEATRFREEFEWKVYSADELVGVARRCGLEPVASAAGFDDRRDPVGELPRMQLVFEEATGR